MPAEATSRLGAYIAMSGAFADREAAASSMYAAGVDPLEADSRHSRAAATINGRSGRH